MEESKTPPTLTEEQRIALAESVMGETLEFILKGLGVNIELNGEYHIYSKESEDPLEWFSFNTWGVDGEVPVVNPTYLKGLTKSLGVGLEVEVDQSVPSRGALDYTRKWVRVGDRVTCPLHDFIYEEEVGVIIQMKDEPGSPVLVEFEDGERFLLQSAEVNKVG